jgi:hypothetical protein
MKENSVTKVDYEYETTEERVRAYLRIPEIDRLRWLEELCVFTSMVRQAPTIYPTTRPTPQNSTPAPDKA